MKIVVTGASGFLGKAVVNALNKMNFEVLPVSRRKIDGYIYVDSYCNTPKADVLIHLAEDNNRGAVNIAGPKYEYDMLQTLESLMNIGYEKVIYASSALLYGDKDIKCYTQDDPVTVVDTYTSLKRQSELRVLQNGNGVIARLSNLYGPGMSAMNVVSAIVNQISESCDLILQDISPVRDFLWVEDAAECLSIMATGVSSGIYNVGSGTGISIGLLAQTALDIACQSHRTICSIKENKKVSHLVLDICQTELIWGWKPRTNLISGIKNLLNKDGF